MSLRAFNSGCNVIAFSKEGKKYGMVCAWAMHVDYDRLALLIGGQSVTGKNINVGDFVGLSALAEGQEVIAHQLGENHSDVGDKFNGIETEQAGIVVYIKDAKVKMYCEVSKINVLNSEGDKLVFPNVLKHTSDKNKKFLPLEAVYPEE